jgi:hypothetical protein
MDLKNLSDDELHYSNVSNATEERELLTRVLHHLRETVLVQLENQTTRAAEKIVCAINPEMKPKKNEINFDDIDDEVLRAKLLQARGLFAHTHPNMSFIEFLYKLCDSEIEKKSKSPWAPKVDSKAETKRQVWRRDQSKCVKCGSTHAVQDEHIIPKAVGGEYTLENICLLCRSCNQRSAIEYFGMKKMSKYLKEPQRRYGVSPLASGQAMHRH